MSLLSLKNVIDEDIFIKSMRIVVALHERSLQAAGVLGGQAGQDKKGDKMAVDRDSAPMTPRDQDGSVSAKNETLLQISRESSGIENLA